MGSTAESTGPESRSEALHAVVAMAPAARKPLQQPRSRGAGKEGTRSRLPSNELGELLLAAWYTHKADKTLVDGTTAPPTITKKRPRSKSHAVLAIAVGFIMLSRAALDMGLPPRVDDLIGGIFLVASAGATYLCACHALTCCPGQLHEVGALLLDRSNPSSWQCERLRFFLEVCTWMAAVWYAYTASLNGWLAILGGALVATTLALTSEFARAYLRRVEERVSRENTRAFGRVLWLKVVASYAGVGYVITATWRSLRGFVLATPLSGVQSVDELVFNYLLITLVGVSLIVASELLLLWDPTRRIGIVLQSRIVDARSNWETHLWRSIAEVAGTFGATVWYYNASHDMLVSLQLGTVCGVALILSSEVLLPSACHPLFAQSLQSEILPADHWIKLAPLVVMVAYFCIKVYGAAVMLVDIPSSSTTSVVWWCVGLATFFLITLAISGAHVSMPDIARVSKRVAGRSCVVGITALACRLCHGLPGIVFSSLLSVFSLALSRECWYEVEKHKTLGTANRRRESSSGDCVDEYDEALTVEDADAGSYSSSFIAYVRREYPYFYKRVNWTFISLVVVSSIEVCSTAIGVMQQDEFSVSLSQLSAGNVVLSSTVGYWTSPLQHELQPNVLLRCGLDRYKKRWELFPLHAFVELVIFVGVFTGTFAATSTVFSSLTLAALSGIVVSVGGHWLCSQLHLTVGNRVRMQLTATCALIFCLLFFSYTSVVWLLSIYHYFDSIEAAFCLASLSGVFFMASSEVFLLWKPTREVGLLLQHRVTHARENWKTEPLRSFLELFTWLAVVWGSFALYDDLLLALQLGTFSGIAVTLSGECFRRNRSRIIAWGERYKLIEKREHPPSPIPSDNSDDDDADDLELTSSSPRPLPVMLLFAYIGSGTFQWIFENIRSLEVTVLLATIAGIAFLCFADLLVLFKPTRWAGVILQDRFLNTWYNWREYPVRSFVELGSFLGVIYGSYVIYGNLVVATQVGTLSGMLVALIGEQVRCRAHAVPLDGENFVISALFQQWIVASHLEISSLQCRCRQERDCQGPNLTTAGDCTAGSRGRCRVQHDLHAPPKHRSNVPARHDEWGRLCAAR